MRLAMAAGTWGMMCGIMMVVRRCASSTINLYLCTSMGWGGGNDGRARLAGLEGTKSKLAPIRAWNRVIASDDRRSVKDAL